MRLHHPAAVLTATIVFLASASVGAECFRITAAHVMKEPMYELVFTGRVVSIARTGENGYRARFEVDRVWKRSVPKLIDVYVWERAGEMPRFEVNQRALVLATKLINPEARQELGLGASDQGAFTPVMCSDVYSLAPTIIEDLGAPRPPRP